jgi:glycerol-3-phosphate dehydrogenase (NAD(P)+)
MRIAVLGAGSWGTALAVLLVRNGHQVVLWGFGEQEVNKIQRTGMNETYLPGVALPAELSVTADLDEAVADAQLILIVTPSHGFDALCQRLQRCVPKDAMIAWATKGLNLATGERLDQVVTRYLPNHPLAVLTGPSFAKDVAQGLPTAVTLACTDQQACQQLQQVFHNDRFRVYLSDDLLGVQLGGVVKNIMAIATGIAEGMQLGANAKAALITRGLAEMQRLAIAMGAQPKTMMGLAGVGDLVLTCTDNQSRNRRFGLALGQGLSAEQAKASIGQVVEGTHNVDAVMALAQQYQVDMPIVAAVQNILAQTQTPAQALDELLSRSVTDED